MGLFGGSKSRTSTTNNTETNTFNNVDNRTGGGNAGNVNFNLANSSVDGNVSVQTTDLNAVAKAFDFADSVVDLAGESSAPSANTINAIGKNLAIVAAIITVGLIFKVRKK